METKPNNRVAVVGLGYVGYPLALLAADKGYRVIGIDIDGHKVSAVSHGRAPQADAPPPTKAQARKIKATTKFSEVAKANYIIVCVPTPINENHLPNLEPLKRAATELSKYLTKGQTVILESTVNPGVSDDVVLPILEVGSGLDCGRDFDLAHCPERINPGDEHWQVDNIPRVIGAHTKAGLKRAMSFYETILDAPLTPLDSLKEAEAVKIVENSFRDINIAFVNELAMLFDKLNINIKKVIEAASTKPFAFMPHYPGCGVGGHCIPVDPYYLIDYAKQHGFDLDLIAQGRRINNTMPAYTVNRLFDGLNEVGLPIKGTRVGILGVSYKPNIADFRESPVFEIINLLKERGAKLAIYDPYVPEQSTARSLKAVLNGVQAIVLATAHKQFCKLTPADFANTKIEVVVDGRNALNYQDFRKGALVYKGIGVN